MERMGSCCLRRGGALIGLAVLALMVGCPPPAPVTPAKTPLVIGMEYALPGSAEGLAQTRLPGVKFLPDLIGWGKMQSSAAASIDFKMLDRLVKEYQGAGFAECMIGLKSESDWASIAPNAALPDTNFAPKPEFMDDYAAWVGAVIERYDGDGTADLPGLKYPIRYYEIGVEFSTYEPEPVQDYLGMLEAAYQAAHAAYPDVVVLQVPFLTTTAFDSNPGPDEYEAAFAAVDPRILYHSLAEIRAILDRPELFDALNFHCLAGAQELEATIRWLRFEMDSRGYDKPLIVSDTSPSPFVGWGAATTCQGDPASLGILLAPATEADRCRLADYFTLLVNGDPDTLDWVRGFVAEDMARMTIVAAEQGIEFLNTSFIEDLFPLNTPLFRAGAGNAAWAGMVETRLNFFTQEHIVKGRRPLFYALRQVAYELDSYNVVERVPIANADVRLYRVRHTEGLGLPDFWIAWYYPAQLVLPGDAVPETTITLETDAPEVGVEKLITQPGQDDTDVVKIPANNGVVEIPLSATPVFIKTIHP